MIFIGFSLLVHSLVDSFLIFAPFRFCGPCVFGFQALVALVVTLFSTPVYSKAKDANEQPYSRSNSELDLLPECHFLPHTDAMCGAMSAAK
jgi:hypothetical protein